MKEMKKCIITVAVCCLFATVRASAYFDNITNLWSEAQHSNVLTIANQRLAVNSNDVAGVLLKASWDFIFADSVTLSNSMDRVLLVGATVTTPAFTNAFETTKEDVVWMNNYLRHEDPSKRTMNIQKAIRRGRMPHYIEELKALDEDGYFTTNP